MEERTNLQTRKGNGTLLVRLQGYNRTPNSPVSVYVYLAYDIDSCDREGRPKWDGNDSWSLDERLTLPGKTSTTFAYGQISNGIGIANSQHYPSESTA
jgi:hypothetical protein